MPRQCATGPQQGFMPDPWSPAVRKYINDGLDDETLGAPTKVIEAPTLTRNSPEDIKEAQRIVNHVARNKTIPKDVAEWRSEKSSDKAAREKAAKQQDELVRAAIQVKEGKMTVPKFRELVEKYNPIIAITEVPTTASLADVAKALDTNKSGTKRILGLPNVNIKDGETVSFRLDIPAYESYDVWVNTIRKEKQNYYSNIGVGNNAIFGGKHTAALKVASGHVLPSGKKISKSPFAVINVAWKNQNIEQTEQEIAEALEDSKQPNSEWKQIGFNPNRSGYFYDKATFLPVASASRVLQLGPLVMAQKVQYVPTKEANVNFNPREKVNWAKLSKEERDYRRAKELEAKQEAVFTIISQQDIAKQKKLNLFIDDEFVRETSVGAVLSLKDSVEHDQRIQGVFMNRLLDNMNTKALNHIKNWGVPAFIIHGDSFKGKSAFYRPTDDLIFVRKTPRINKIDQKPNQKDLEITALHEYGHFVHNRLAEMRTGAARFTDTYYIPKEFKDAIEKESIGLGMKIYVPELLTKDIRYQSAVGSGIGLEVAIKSILDGYMNDFVTYNHLFYNPSVREELIAKLKAIEERPIGEYSGLTIAGMNLSSTAREQAENRKKREAAQLIWGSSTNKLPTGVTYYETFNRGYSKDLEAYHHTHRTIPTPSEMLRKIEKLQNNKGLAERVLSRLKVRNVTLKYHLKVYNSRGSKEYLRGFYDILDAMTIGAASEMGLPGHDAMYFSKKNNPEAEIFANIFEAYANKDQRAWKTMREQIPVLTKAFERIMFTNKNKKWTSKNELESITRQLFSEGG